MRKPTFGMVVESMVTGEVLEIQLCAYNEKDALKTFEELSPILFLFSSISTTYEHRLN